MVRLIAKLLVLVAVLLMPLGMSAAPATPAHHGTSARMPMEHCPDQAPSHDSKRGFGECTMACAAALPAADLPPDQHLLIARTPTAPADAQILRGLHPDTATPPPKSS